MQKKKRRKVHVDIARWRTHVIIMYSLAFRFIPFFHINMFCNILTETKKEILIILD